MKCPRCQHENEAGAKFCEECAAPLARACAKCGRQLSPTAKFCPECAQPTGLAAALPAAQRFGSPESYTPKHLAERILTSKSALEGERKQITVLFADLKGSMELLADRDPEEARTLLDPVLERMMEAVHRYEGTVNQVMGDGIMALFGAPVAHEDHAVRACYSALRMQEAVKRYAADVRRMEGIAPQIRVGLNSGGVVVRAIASDLRMDYTAVGQTTHLAARMEQAATAGSILITAETLRLVEGYVVVKPLGPVSVKGLDQPVQAYELTGAATVRTRLQASAARGLTKFVGRGAEMDLLRRAHEQAGHGRGQVVAVVGEPGVGKSRLFYEFTRSHRTQGALVLESSSVSYGKATSYLPVIDMLKSYFAVHDGDTHRQIREKIAGKVLTLDRALLYYWVRGEVPTALDLAQQLYELAQHVDDPVLRMLAHEVMGEVTAYLPDFRAARSHMEQCLAVYDPSQHRSLGFRYGGYDVGMAARAIGAHALCCLGFPDRALAWSRSAVALARDLSHLTSLAFALGHAGILHYLRREPRLTLDVAEEVLALSAGQDLEFWKAFAEILRGWALVRLRRGQEGIESMRQGLEGYRVTAGELESPIWLAMMADAYLVEGAPDEGLSAVARALELVNAMGVRIAEAELFSLAGHAVCDGGLMLDLSLMKGVHVDPARRTVRAGGGVIWRELNRETQAHRLAVTGGVISTTGIAGLTLGGGLGWLMGKHGLALDNLLSAEVVTAGGDTLHASQDENPDLFWALRGGGGNFGVVPWFEYRLHPVGPVTSGLVAHPVARAADVLRLFRDATRSAPDELMLFGALLYAPDGSGTPLAAIVACHSGTVAEGETALGPIKKFGSAVLDTIGPASYEATNMMLDAGFPPGALAYWKSTFIPELSDAAIETLIAGFRECPSPMSGLIVEHFHGAAARVGASDTAFPHRREAFNLLINSEWLEPGDTARNIAWARQIYDAMRPYSAGTSYVNYMSHDERESPAEVAYGPALGRLRALKAKYDPANLFHLNQNIRPAS